MTRESINLKIKSSKVSPLPLAQGKTVVAHWPCVFHFPSLLFTPIQGFPWNGGLTGLIRMIRVLISGRGAPGAGGFSFGRDNFFLLSLKNTQL